MIRQLRRLLVLLCFSVLILMGCANSVSTKTVSLEVDVEISFHEPINTNNYNYYLVLNPETTPKVSTENISHDLKANDYLPTPGRGYSSEILDNEIDIDKRDLSYYYTRFFSSWTDYFAIDENGLRLYKSNDTQFTLSETNSHQSYLPNSSFPSAYSKSNTNKTLSFTFSPDQLSSVLQTSKSLYFTIFVTKRFSNDASDESGRLVDTLRIEIDPLKLQANQDSLGTNLENFDINDANGPADIVSFRLQVF